MSIVKTLRFPVEAGWSHGRVVRLDAPGKPALTAATPPEFRGGIPGRWSPEELLVAAVAACHELTLAAVAERMEVPLGRVSARGLGHVERGRGGYAFTVVELDVELETEPGHEEAAREAARLAHERCIVGRALDVPVHVRLSIRPLRAGREAVAS